MKIRSFSFRVRWTFDSVISLILPRKTVRSRLKIICHGYLRSLILNPKLKLQNSKWRIQYGDYVPCLHIFIQ